MFNIARRLDAHVESVVASTELKNGQLIKLTERKAGEREIFNASIAVSADGVAERLLIHASPERQYDERALLQDFKGVGAGEVGRALHVTVGDVFEPEIGLLEEGTVVTATSIEPGVFLQCGTAGKYAPVSDVSVAEAKDITNANQKLVFKYLGKGTRFVGMDNVTKLPKNETFMVLQAWT